ncbi:hypothetical protein [Enterococcus innesii]|uniref:hypothetical protein n=1 Tax=Enterococcus innesii TaxID=2839759 RepID=UPI0034A17A54
MKYDLAAYFQTGIQSEIKRMELKYGKDAVIKRMELKYGKDAVLTGIETYLKQNKQEDQ